MFELGKRNLLKVLRESPYGLYLDAGDGTGILLPKAEIPANTNVGDRLRVFVYLDSDDHEIATLKHALAQVGEFARLRVKEVNDIGAFLDWGLAKDLLLPFAEQRQPATPGALVNVYLYIDNSGRIAATTKTDRYLEYSPTDLKSGDLVELIPWRMTDLGMLCIVDHRYEGMIHRQDLTQQLKLGAKTPGYVKHIRPDGRIDIMMQAPGYERVTGLAHLILEDLRDRRGFIPLNDKSTPEAINERYGCSKKAFKMAIGQLLKKEKIDQDEKGLHLLE